MQDYYDFAVLGGGLVGSAIAYGLVREGRKVLMLDEGDVAMRASRGNFALVWVQNKGLGMPAYAEWTRRSSDLWQNFATDLQEVAGFDLAYRRPGGYHLVLTEAELQRRADMFKRLHNQPGVRPYKIEVIDGDEVRRRLPEAGPEVAGATFCSLDGDVNSLKLFRAMHHAFHRLGGTYRSEALVEKIEPGTDGFSLTTKAGRFSAARIVLAAGLGNERLGAMVGMNVPVRPVRGQIIVTEKTAPFLDMPLSTIRQTDEGGVMIGDSQEEAADYNEMRQGIMAVMADRAVRMFPRLGSLNVVRTWSALRVMSRDGFPIYDQSEACPGAFVATCHSGVTLAAAHAGLFAPAVSSGALPTNSTTLVCGDSMFQRLPEITDTGLAFTVDGRTVHARTGDTVAAALLLAGIETCRTTPVKGTPRAPYCMMGVCFDCLVTIDGVGNQQACLRAVREGMEIQTQIGRGKRELGR